MNTRSLLTLGAVSALAVLTGCATQQPTAYYGHPALYAAQPVVVVQQPAQVVYAQPYPQSYAHAPGYAQAPARNDPVRTAVGAIAGGVVGSQFGGSRNARTAATVVGAGAGAMVAQGQYSNEALGGAVLGGIVGSRFGSGEGRNAAAAIGAGLGAWMAVRD